MWRSVSTSSVLCRAFMRIVTSSKRVTSDGFISSSACISKSAATGILSGVCRRGVLRDDCAFSSSSGIVRKVFVEMEQPIVLTIIPVSMSVLLWVVQVLFFQQRRVNSCGSGQLYIQVDSCLSRVGIECETSRLFRHTL